MTITYLNTDSGIEEVGGAYLDGGGTGHHEGDGILSRTDASQTDDGDLDSLCHLPHHAQRHMMMKEVSMNKDVKLSPHFTLGELTRTSYHTLDGNIPSHVAIENLRNLCENWRGPEVQL